MQLVNAQNGSFPKDGETLEITSELSLVPLLESERDMPFSQ